MRVNLIIMWILLIMRLILPLLQTEDVELPQDTNESQSEAVFPSACSTLRREEDVRFRRLNFLQLLYFKCCFSGTRVTSVSSRAQFSEYQ